MRCKMMCHYKQDMDDIANISFSAVTTGSEDNMKFFKDVPAGMISFCTVNADMAKEFEIGKKYYVDFSPVDTPGTS